MAILFTSRAAALVLCSCFLALGLQGTQAFSSTPTNHVTTTMQRAFGTKLNSVESSSSSEDPTPRTELKNPLPDKKLENSENSLSSASASSVDKTKCLSLLQDALVQFNSTAAADFISEITKLRQEQSNNNQEVVNDLLNWLLEQGPDSSKLPLWSRLKPLSRYSKRARWVSLRRTLDLTTPPFNAVDEGEDTAENQQRRRRRALVTVVRALSSASPLEKSSYAKRPAIRVLEQKAAQEQKLMKRSRTDEDLTLRRPEGLETPNYTVLDKVSNTFEIRRYENYSVCSVSMNKPRPTDSSKTDATVSEPTMRGASSFGALAGYLFGKNEQEQAMKMTTPVLFNTIGDGEETKEKVMSFVLPSEYWKNETALGLAPQPFKESGVTLQRFEGSDRAVVLFGGYASQKSTDQQTELLRKKLAQSSKWQAVDGDTVSVAQYNDPFTPPWKRLNEVSIAVQPRP